jgi:hypothetical protein
VRFFTIYYIFYDVCTFSAVCGIVGLMDSLQDIISKFGKPEQPELIAVKRYIDERFHVPASAAINGDSVVITVKSAAGHIRSTCNIEKRLVFRIG